MDIQEINKFKDYLRSEGLKPTTIYQYGQHLKLFFQFLGNRDMSESLIRAHILQRGDSCAPDTINQDLKTISLYLKSIGRKNEIILPKYRKRMRKLPIYFTEEFFKNEIMPIVDMLDHAIRKKAILYFVFYLGIRRRELQLIKRKDIDMQNRTVKITDAKNSHERIVPLPKIVLPYLRDYFISEAEKTNAFNAGGSTLSYICSELNQNIDSVRLHSHSFRHSMATHYMKKGIKLQTLQYLLGHSSILSTMVYAHRNTEEIQKEVNKLIR